MLRPSGKPLWQSWPQMAKTLGTVGRTEQVTPLTLAAGLEVGSEDQDTLGAHS